MNSLPSRARVSSSGWDFASNTTCVCPLHFPNALQDAHCSYILGGRVDDKHPWLHSRQGMAGHGCRLPYHSPHNLPPQLWPLHHLDGLDVWHAPWASRYPQERVRCVFSHALCGVFNLLGLLGHCLSPEASVCLLQYARCMSCCVPPVILALFLVMQWSPGRIKVC